MNSPDPSGFVDNNRIEELLTQIPSRLYRYSGLTGEKLQWMKELIVDAQLHFAPPSAFNDPFDCRVPLHYEASPLFIEQFWRRAAKRQDPNFKASLEKTWIRRMVFDSKTPEGQSRLSDLVFESLNAHGMVCFAKDPTSTLLWSYYAEGHTGIAVRFNMSLKNLGEIAGAPGGLLPVEMEYRRDFPLVNFFKRGPINEFVMKMLGTKSEEWKHEKEWRIVLLDRHGLVRIPRRMVDGIILGMRIDPCTEEIVRDWVAQRSPTLEVQRVVNRRGTYELVLEPAWRQ